MAANVQNPGGLDTSASVLRRSRWGRANFLEELRKATTNLDFTLEYQAQLSLLTGRVTNFEALLRWRHPVWGDVPPSSFVPVAERVGLIGRIDRWVLERACSEATKWPAEIGVSVNVSAGQLELVLVSEVLAALAQSGLPPQRLELEVTETAMMPAVKVGVPVLNALRNAGVKIAIDDFDVGYASLNYLIGFPFDRLKIDRSVISHLGTAHTRAPVARMVVQSIATLCRDLGVSCVAEGVESLQQLDVIRDAGFTDVQGFFLAPPVQPIEIPEILNKLNNRFSPAITAPTADIQNIDFIQIAETAGDIIIVADAMLDLPGPKIIYVNSAFTRLTGFTAAETIGRSPRMLQGPGTSRKALDKIAVGLRAGEPVHEKVLNYGKSGAPYWLDLRVCLRTRHWWANRRSSRLPIATWIMAWETSSLAS